MDTGRVTGYEIGKNKEGEIDTLLLQVEISEPDDVQTVELYGSGGRDYNPPTNSTVIVLSIADAMKIAVAVNDGIVPESEPGEAELYSVDEYGGEKKARVKVFTDGKCKINEGGPAAARVGDEVKSVADPLSLDSFWTWVAGVTAYINGIAPGTLTLPTEIVGEITTGSESVEIGD
jgi:hypothetical protein